MNVNEIIYFELKKDIKQGDWVPILKTGYVPSKEKEFTDEDLQNILKAFADKTMGENIETPIVLTHLGNEAVGWIKDLKLENGYIYAKIEWNEEGKKIIEKKSYRYLSPEIIHNVEGQNKNVYPSVLFRVALTNTPALDLPPLDREVNDFLIPYGSYTYFSYTEEEKAKLVKEQEKRVKKYGIQPKSGGQYVPPKEYAEAGATSPEDYADPVNYKYPINTAEFARAALNYFSKPANHNIYSPEERDIIWERIVRACVKFDISVAYNQSYHKNLPENLKKKMEGYKEEESVMEDKIVELENQLKAANEKIAVLEKEKEDRVWAEKVKFLLDNGYILPAMEKDILSVDPNIRNVVYETFSKTKLVELSQVNKFQEYSEPIEDLEIKKAVEETKELLKKKEDK